MDTITVNGYELSIDLMEADNLERFENAMQEASRKVDDKSAQEGMSNADMYRYQCKCVDEFFDNVFGPGTAEKIFGPGNTNIRDHIDAFGKASLMPAQSGTDITHLMNSYSEQANDIVTSSKMNREQRRAQEKRERRAARNLKVVEAQKDDQEEQETEQEETGSEAKDDTQEKLDEFVAGLTDEQKEKLAETLTSGKA